MKRCGKSAPRERQRKRHGKPHREQDQIGTACNLFPDSRPGRSREAFGNERPRGMAIHLLRRNGGGQNPAYRPSDANHILTVIPGECGMRQHAARGKAEPATSTQHRPPRRMCPALRLSSRSGIPSPRAPRALAAVDILPDAPEHTCRIGDRKIADRPGLIPGRCRAHAIALHQSGALDMGPPAVHIGDQQMHHEILRMVALVEILQQEAGVAGMEIGQCLVRPCDDKAEFGIEALGQGKVPCGDEGFELDSFQGHARVLAQCAITIVLRSAGPVRDIGRRRSRFRRGRGHGSPSRPRLVP